MGVGVAETFVSVGVCCGAGEVRGVGVEVSGSGFEHVLENVVVVLFFVFFGDVTGPSQPQLQRVEGCGYRWGVHGAFPAHVFPITLGVVAPSADAELVGFFGLGVDVSYFRGLHDGEAGKANGAAGEDGEVVSAFGDEESGVFASVGVVVDFFGGAFVADVRRINAFARSPRFEEGFAPSFTDVVVDGVFELGPSFIGVRGVVVVFGDFGEVNAVVGVVVGPDSWADVGVTDGFEPGRAHFGGAVFGGRPFLVVAVTAGDV